MCLSFTGIHVPVILKHGFCLGHRVFHTIRCNRVHEYYTLFLLNRVYYLNITSTTYILRLFLPNTLFTLLAYTYITLSQSHRIRISTTTGPRRPPCRNSSMLRAINHSDGVLQRVDGDDIAGKFGRNPANCVRIAKANNIHDAYSFENTRCWSALSAK